MATPWASIYNQICSILLEDGGFQLSVINDSQFFQMGGEVLTDFLYKTGIIRKIFNVPLSFALGEYAQPEQLAELIAVLVNGQTLFETSGFFLDNADPDWQGVRGAPEAYRQDEVPVKTVRIYPAPAVEGNQVRTLNGVNGWGVLAATSNPNDFDETTPLTTPKAYGTANAFGGNPYVEVLNQGWGVRASKVASTNNLQLLGTCLPFTIEGITMTSYVELLPDSFTPYLKYGILARIYSSDSELRDAQKAAYCQSRYAEGISLGTALMADAYQES